MRYSKDSLIEAQDKYIEFLEGKVSDLFGRMNSINRLDKDTEEGERLRQNIEELKSIINK